MNLIIIKFTKKYLYLILFKIASNKANAKAEKPEKKTRKKKDVDAPKKPMSSFFWY